jgi:predicted enzyme related to lactoylglutathione lyase
MSTDDCEVTLEALEAARIEVVRGPSEHAWGIEAPFVDPFGNEFVLFEYASG